MPSEDICQDFWDPFQRNPSILDSAARQLRDGQRLTESFTTMSRKHSTLFSRNSEREVMPETRPRMNCVRRRRPRNFSGSHSTSDLISSRLPVVAVATFTYPRSVFFPQALEKWTSLPPLSLSLSISCHDRVNGFYCSFAVPNIPRAFLFPTPHISSPINSLVGPDFSARNHEIPLRAFYRRGIKRVPVFTETRSPQNPVVTRRSIRVWSMARLRRVVSTSRANISAVFSIPCDICCAKDL